MPHIVLIKVSGSAREKWKNIGKLEDICSWRQGVGSKLRSCRLPGCSREITSTIPFCLGFVITKGWGGAVPRIGLSILEAERRSQVEYREKKARRRREEDMERETWRGRRGEVDVEGKGRIVPAGFRFSLISSLESFHLCFRGKKQTQNPEPMKYQKTRPP